MPPGNTVPTWIVSASLDGDSSEEVGWFITEGAGGAIGDRGILSYPPSDGSTLRILGFTAKADSEVVANGTSTGTNGTTQTFIDVYGEGASGWGLVSHLTAAPGPETRRTTPHLLPMPINGSATGRSSLG